MPRDSQADHTRTFALWVLSCFFLSGIAGLIYQILWLRMIDKVIGSAPFAVATVLSVFMGGLALGSWLAGKHIDRIASRRNLLSLYGKVELIIGVYGLLLPLLIPALKPLYAVAYNALFLHFWVYRIFTFLGCALILIIPTTLMGITLPVLCRFYVEDLGHIGARTGRLYGINTIGAAVGAILCGFFFIAKFGIWGSLGIAAGINFLVGLLCIVLSRAARPGTASAPPESTLAAASDSSPAVSFRSEEGKVRLALWIFAVSGFCSMAYEVFWTRLLGLSLGPTTYSFSLVVATFIIGLALGNILFGWIADRTRGAFGLLIATQLCAAGLALVVSQFLGNSQFFFSKLIYSFQGDFGEKSLVQSIILFFILVGPTIFLGATFPLVNRIYARSLPHIGRSIGTAYAVNTVGAILGSFVAGFILIPFLGKENGLRLTAGLQLLVCLVALAYSAATAPKKTRVLGAGVPAMALCALLLINFPSWDHNALSRGWYYRFDTIKQHFSTTSWLEAIRSGTSKIAAQVTDTDLVFYGDGIGGFTTVEKWVDPVGTPNYYLINSGKTDASSHADRLTQALSAHVPLLFHPNPEKVMVLGLASGMTAGEALLYPVEQLDVLEINDQVIKAAEFFTPWNNSVLTHPDTRMIVQDGRNHLELTRETYDVIISEPSNPWMAGLANLFTLDYFETVKDRLNPDGIFVQWTNAYDMDWESFSMIGRTFAAVFPDGLLIKTISSSDFLLVGFAGEKKLDLDTAEKNLVYANRSQNVVIRNPRTLFDLIVTEEIRDFFGPGPLHTDNWPHLEFAAPKIIGASDQTIQDKIREERIVSDATQRILEANRDMDGILDRLELLTAGFTPPFQAVNLETASQAQRERFQQIFHAFCNTEYITDYTIFPTPALQRAAAEIQVERIRKHLAGAPEDSKAYFRLATGLEVLGAAEEAVTALQTAIGLVPAYFDAHMKLGEILASLKEYDAAVAHLSRALEIVPDSAEARSNLGNLLADRGDTQAAIANFSEALRLDPDSATAHNNLGSVLATLGRTDQAIFHLTRAIELEPDYAAAHNNLGRLYAARGDLEKAIDHFQEAIRIAPASADFHNDAGLALGQQGDMEASIRHFSEAIRLTPRHFLAHYNLGIAQLNGGALSEAADHFFKAVEITPGDPEVRRILGKTLGNLGRMEAAVEQFTEALRLAPDNAETHDDLGVALARTDRLAEAVSHFRQALEIDGDYHPARIHLETLQASAGKSGAASGLPAIP